MYVSGRSHMARSMLIGKESCHSSSSLVARAEQGTSSPVPGGLGAHGPTGQRPGQFRLPLDEESNQAVKNICDRFLAVVAILLAAPLMAIVAILVRITSRRANHPPAARRRAPRHRVRRVQVPDHGGGRRPDARSRPGAPARLRGEPQARTGPARHAGRAVPPEAESRRVSPVLQRPDGADVGGRAAHALTRGSGPLRRARSDAPLRQAWPDRALAGVGAPADDVRAADPARCRICRDAGPSGRISGSCSRRRSKYSGAPALFSRFTTSPEGRRESCGRIPAPTWPNSRKRCGGSTSRPSIAWRRRSISPTFGTGRSSSSATAAARRRRPIWPPISRN